MAFMKQKNSPSAEVLGMERGGRFSFLLISLLALLVLNPFFEGLPFFGNLGDLFLTAIFLVGLWVVSQQRLWLAIGILLAVPMLALLWVGSRQPPLPLALAGSLCGTLFCLLLVVKILQYIFHVRQVTWDVINAAVVVYLLFGVLWAFAFGTLETLRPGSFVMGSLPENVPLPFAYFSFVTLTTVGYGDFLPLSAEARSLANLEGLVGQIYLTVLVARLVGMQMSQARE